MENILKAVAAFIRTMVRPYISVAITSAIVYLGVLGKIEPKDLLALAGVIIAFHFAERAAKNGNK
jgi:hypothetical protein